MSLKLQIPSDQKTALNIYRKPTTTDAIINYKSCHPTGHKCSAVKFFTDYLHSYPLSYDDKKKELHITEDILHKNEYPPIFCNTTLHKPNASTQEKNTTKDEVK
jgi:hypothetical protein